MKTKKKLKKLIVADILNCKLNMTLINIGIDSNLYLVDISDVIFDIAKIKRKHKSTKLREEYFNLINKGIDIDLRIEENKLAELINEVIVFLKNSTCGESVGK